LARDLLDDPFRMRRWLKYERNTVGDAVLFEADLSTFMRAKRKAIGWRLYGLFQYIGPDPGPVSTWGLSSQPPVGEELDALCDIGPGYIPRVAPGARPLDPEFAPDALVKAYECWMASHPKLWLPQLMLMSAAKRAPTGNALSPRAAEFLASLREIALKELARRSTRSRDLDCLLAHARSLVHTVPMSDGHVSAVAIGAAWQLVCRELCQILGSQDARNIVRGEETERAEAA
jgi:hypothetical protein